MSMVYKSKGISGPKRCSVQEVNVAADRNAAMEMIRKSGQRGVPVVDIDGNIVVGFDQGKSTV